MNQRETGQLDFWSFVKGFAFGVAILSFGWGVRVFASPALNTIWVIACLFAIGLGGLNIIGALILGLVPTKPAKEKDGDAR